MQSRWSAADARAFAERYISHGEDLALRVYTSRLVGSDPALVLHGGGNTSVKSTIRDLLGEEVAAIFVKGSGWNLDTIAPEGLPGMRLAGLRRLRHLPALSDEEMVNQQRTHLFRADAPTPSVEALLHAFLPAKFIDHSHADSILALTNRPDGEALVREIYGDRAGIVPYVMPGFALALKAAEVNDAQADLQGLVLLKHGLFTWGETARESYERHIEMVDLAERWLAVRSRRTWTVVKAAADPETVADVADIADIAAELAPLLRGRLAGASGDPDRPFRRMIVEWKGGEEILDWVNGAALDALARTPPLTPDHVIRTKGLPLVVSPPSTSTPEAWAAKIETALADYTRDYLTVMFSHPSVIGVLTWGFWEKRHWIPAAAYYRADWTLRPAGQVWQNLVRKTWWTDTTAQTGEQGRISLRAFLGDYEITVRSAGLEKTVPAKLDKNGAQISVELAP